MKNKSKNKEKRFEYSKGERALIAGLSSFALTFIYIFFGSIDIFANNYEEYLFTVGDFIVPLLCVFFISFAFLFLLLYCCNGMILNAITVIVFSVIITGYLDTGIINKTSFSSGDITEPKSYILTVIVLFIVIYVSLFISIKMKKNWKKAVIYLSVLFIAMNSATLISDFAKCDFINKDNSKQYVLSKQDLYSVSENENIIFFIVDRFDNEYYKGLIKKNPDFFNDFDGFTYYNNNISMYSRTFPSITYLITGNEYKGDISPTEFLETTYSNSGFLNDLEQNGYTVNFYSQLYYSYKDAGCMNKIVNNVQEIDSMVSDKKEILKYLISLSAARNWSFLLSSLTYDYQCDGTSSKLVDIKCKDGIYKTEDAKFFEELKKNSLSYSGDKKNYIFIHLHGSHSPYNIDSNGQLCDQSDPISQTEGCLKMIKYYLIELKRLGVYDKSTIVITGDHGNPYTDTIGIKDWESITFPASTTALLFKSKTSINTQYRSSNIPLCAKNIIPSLIEENNIKTEKNYGNSIHDVENGTKNERYYHQLLYSPKTRKIVIDEYRVDNNAQDLKNWKHIKSINTNYAWY